MLSRTLVLADLHLTRGTPARVTRDLAALVEAHPGSRIVVAGDLLDLSAESPPPSVRDALFAHPSVRAALGEHVTRGGELWLAGGNHDADVGHAGFAEVLADILEVPRSARRRLRTTPWFFREGALHVEHGHHYDPDNAPAHPLVHGSASLGVHFVEAFIAPTRAHAYLNANDGTPLELFAASFRGYGLRAPYIIYRFFHVALSSLLRSGPFYRARGELRLGDARADTFAAAHDVDRRLVDQLLGLGARPTLESLPGTFARLYLDRVIATLSLGAGLASVATGHAAAGLAALSLGAAVMGGSWARGHDRYGGTVGDRLAASAAQVAEVTSAKLVVFGHVHREAEQAAYVNTGSFAFPRGAPGRPYLEIEGSRDNPRAIRRYWSSTSRIEGSLESA